MYSLLFYNIYIKIFSIHFRLNHDNIAVIRLQSSYCTRTIIVIKNYIRKHERSADQY